ncbi:MAG TPA: hypothetical protein VHT96_08060 [Clostridia bacterium]|nr:hypothetical protein [Clostridia bacterium]
MIRDLTAEFLPESSLEFPVKVFHEIFHPTGDFQQGSIVFILNPKRIKQEELMFLLKYDACFVFYIGGNDEAASYESHPVRLLLSDKNANSHLERIKGLRKNIVEMSTVKYRKWDVLGITTSFRQLFSIRNIGYCFMEYPVITENTFDLDDVFIQESLKSASPAAIISKYLQIAEHADSSKLEQMNRRNAFQKVFSFYKTGNEDYRFLLDPQDVEFLVDVLKLESLADKPLYRAEIIGALTSACSYFIHSGYPDSYEIVLKKLMETIPPEGCKTVRYKYITEKDLEQMKSCNAFLYYHLTCRIPNQYSVSLLDMYLTETDHSKRLEMGSTIEKWLTYLKNRIMELSLAQVNLLWEFKRDQEIGAMSGTVGLLTLYKKVLMEDDTSAYGEAANYFNKAIEYAHPDERNRDINYYVQCRLSEIVAAFASSRSPGEGFQREIGELAGLYAGRFTDQGDINVFDVMFSVNLVVLGYFSEGEERALELYRRIGLDWDLFEELFDKHSHQYSAHLASGYLLMAPKVLLKDLSTDIFIKNSTGFFELDDENHAPKEIMDLIALKYMISHSYYISNSEEGGFQETIERYRKIINDSPLYTKWSDACGEFLDDCLKRSASGWKALKLIFTIPY